MNRIAIYGVAIILVFGCRQSARGIEDGCEAGTSSGVARADEDELECREPDPYRHANGGCAGIGRSARYTRSYEAAYNTCLIAAYDASYDYQAYECFDDTGW